MITPQQQAGKVWENILPHIRSARKRRKRVKSSLAAGAICALAAILLILDSRTIPVAPQVAIAEPSEAYAPGIAVMKVGDDGVIRLEECMPDELGAIELVFGLAPIIANDWEIVP